MGYTVYTISNLTDGKVLYVGKTSNFEKRAKEHLTLNSSNTKEWIASIGVGNISITPIAEFSTEEEALKYEDEMILRYNTIEDGYNIRRSGLIYATDVNEYQRQYRETHRDELAGYMKHYQQEHKAEIAEYQKHYQQQYYQEHKEQNKLYREEHKEEIAVKKKRYREEHKDEHAAYNKKYYQDHRGAILEQRENNKEQRREYDKMRYQKKKAEKQIQMDIAATPNGQFVELTIPF